MTIRGHEWQKYWSGNWSLLTLVYFAYYYTRYMEKQLGVGLHHVVGVSQKGYSACFFDCDDRRRFGIYRARRITRTKETVRAFCADMKRRADHLIRRTKVRGKRLVTQKEHAGFLQDFFQYTGLHITPRNIIDHVTEKKARALLRSFVGVRLYTENVYKKTEEYMEAWALEMSAVTKYPAHLLLCLMPEEVNRYFVGGKLPARNVLAKRYASSALYIDRRRVTLYTGKDAEKVERMMTRVQISDVVQGFSAYPGKAIGTARIIFEPRNAHSFRRGDILITGMTRPEFLPLMVEAGAIVTDVGGVLSHAAITARELKKPCIIGTKIATQVLQDGDRVEVDAEKGIVRKL